MKASARVHVPVQQRALRSATKSMEGAPVSFSILTTERASSEHPEGPTGNGERS